MLLYIHVPFCIRKCVYCAFTSVPITPFDLEVYLTGLGREIALWGDRLKRRKVSTIFFGGGTPSLMPENVMQDIFGKLRRAFTFSKNMEITMEANPESLTNYGLYYLQTLRGLGVNRLSIGVQSFRDEQLKFLGRAHSAAQAETAVALARQAGFRNISLDLIWGLPGQRLKTWKEELKRAAELEPTHLSCYGLTIEPGTPLEKMSFAHDLNLPSEEELARMYTYGGDFLESRGYLQYEVSNYAKMGFLCRHNQGYWEGKDYLGLGPSAVSTVLGRRWDNPSDIAEYVEAAVDNRLGANAEALTLTERARELVMLRLRTSRGLRLKAYADLLGRDFMKDHKTLIHGLHKSGLARISKGYFRLSRNGMLVSNAILERFFGDFPDLERGALEVGAVLEEGREEPEAQDAPDTPGTPHAPDTAESDEAGPAQEGAAEPPVAEEQAAPDAPPVQAKAARRGSPRPKPKDIDDIILDMS